MYITRAVGKRKKKGRERSEKKVLFGSKPSLDRGINMVEKPGKKPVFQALVAEELEASDKEAVWIDTGNEASTYALRSFGDETILEKVRIGRSFTPFQHHTAVQQVEDSIKDRTEILVVPRVTELYLDGQLSDWEAEQLFAETWKTVEDVQDRYGLKVLVSLPDASGLDYMVEGSADNRIDVRDTSQGWNYSSRDYKTPAYRNEGVLQTTIDFWGMKTGQEAVLETGRV